MSNDPSVSGLLRINFPERPTYSLLRTKAGIIGRPIRETHGDVMDQVAARSGVLRVSNGFRCPDNMTNGGTFTDAMGSTCGVRIVLGGLEDAAGVVAGGGENHREPSGSLGNSIDKLRDSGDPSSRLSAMSQTGIDLALELSGSNKVSRIRFSIDDLIDEALDPVRPDVAVDLVMERRPAEMYPHTQGAVRGFDISEADLASDSYIRSLGTALLLEALQKVKAGQGENIQAVRKKFEAERRKYIEEKERLDAHLNMLYDDQDESMTKVVDRLDKLGDGEFAVMSRGPEGERFIRRPWNMGAVLSDGTFNPTERARLMPGAQDVFYATYEMEIEIPDDPFFYIEVQVLAPQHKDLSSPGSSKGIQPIIELNLRSNANGSLVRDNFLHSTDRHDPETKKLITPQIAKAAETIEAFLINGFDPKSSWEKEEWQAVAAEMDAASANMSPLSNILEIEKEISVVWRERFNLKKPELKKSEYSSQVALRKQIYAAMRRHGFRMSRSLDESDFTVTGEKIDGGAENYATKFGEWLAAPQSGKNRGFRISADHFEDEGTQRLIKEAAETAISMFPESWQKTLLSRGVNFIMTPNSRAFARAEQGGFTTIALSKQILLNKEDFASVMLHEMTHAVQNYTPTLNEAEYVMFRRRVEENATGQRLVDLLPGHGYADNEIAVGDDVDNAYMFKLYPTAANELRPYRISEVSSMLMEMLLGSRFKSGGDLDAIAFMVGILMDHGTQPAVKSGAS